MASQTILETSTSCGRSKIELSKQKWKHIGLRVGLLGSQRGHLKGSLEEDLKDKDEDQIGQGRVDKDDEDRMERIERGVLERRIRVANSMTHKFQR